MAGNGEFIIGCVKGLEEDRNAGWYAFRIEEYRNTQLELEIKRLQRIIKKLRKRK